MDKIDWETELYKVIVSGILKKIKNNETLSESQQNIYNMMNKKEKNNG